MTYDDCLIEIGTEELPPTALSRLSQAFATQLAAQLAEQQLAYRQLDTFATPRRLALLIHDLATATPEQTITRRGPALAAAFTAAGTPTQAALGFARSCGVTVEDLARLETNKGAWLVHHAVTGGQATAEHLPTLIEAALRELPIPRRMRWGAGEAEFVRPVHWVCVLLGAQPVPGSVLGVPIGATTYGHRFHAPAAIVLTKPSDYAPRLREAQVEPDMAARQALIEQQVAALCEPIDALPALSAELLDEISALCEWPVALLGRFDAEFLAVPAEVLIETMQKNQKYIALRARADNQLLPQFITVANIASRDPAVVQAGNERVIRPRFADAQFFWEQDRKQPLETRLERLKSVVYQDKLGSLWARSARLATLAANIAEQLTLDPAAAERAAWLAKCDLVTQMVGEFPSLQGIIGGYYAAASGETSDISQAIAEHYQPRQAGDALPDSPLGRVLALADKLDLLVGAFAIGARPSGVKDPYGLRRAAIASLRLLIEPPLKLDLRLLLEQSAATFPADLAAASVIPDVLNYMFERLHSYYDEQGIAADRVDAVLAIGVTEPADIDARVRAVDAFYRLPEAAALAAANKRIRNLLKKAAITDGELETALLHEPAEQALAQALATVQQQVAPLIATGDYAAAFLALATLREPVDAFFDQVMVMCEDPALQRNRLELLAGLERLFLGLADVARLQTP